MSRPRRRQRAPIVVLLTDFGSESYAGIVKGVVLCHCPDAVLVDLAHDVAPGAVREAAWHLLTAYRFFPLGTVFLAVVDPDVGTERQALALEAGGYYFVGPDNGLVYPAAASAGMTAAVALPIPPHASPTFHGRDVFAPAAARLAAGKSLEDLGTPTRPRSCLSFYLQGREGEVVTVDRFGNAITNLPPLPGRYSYRLTLSRRGKQYFQGELPAHETYARAPLGTPFLLVGSAGTLEVSVRNDSAARLLGIEAGDRIKAE